MKSLAAILAILSVSAFAQTEFVGALKGSNQICKLLIQQVYFEGTTQDAQNLRADVVVALIDDHGHGEELFFTVKPNGANIFGGFAQNQKDQVNVITKAGSLNDLSAYAVKWIHGSHFHSAQCLNLKRAN